MSIFDDEKYGPLYDINPIKPLFDSPKPDVDLSAGGIPGTNYLENSVTEFRPNMDHIRPNGSIDFDVLDRNTGMNRLQDWANTVKDFGK